MAPARWGSSDVKDIEDLLDTMCVVYGSQYFEHSGFFFFFRGRVWGHMPIGTWMHCRWPHPMTTPHWRTTQNSSLTYWVCGEALDVWYTVVVSLNTTIGALKKLIVQNTPTLSRSNTASLRVYRIPADPPALDDDPLRQTLGALCWACLCELGAYCQVYSRLH